MLFVQKEIIGPKWKPYSTVSNRVKGNRRTTGSKYVTSAACLKGKTFSIRLKGETVM